MNKMTIDAFFAKYGHLLPTSYKRMMRAMYNSLKVGGEMFMPDPEGNPIVITKK